MLLKRNKNHYFLFTVRQEHIIFIFMNKNGLRSRNLIREAFMHILKEKDAKLITVTDIASKAGINRSTFYAHYSCIQDVMDEMQKEVMDKMNDLLKNFSFQSFFSDTTQMLLEMNHLIEDNIVYYRILLYQEHTDLFIRKLNDLFVDYMKKDQSIPASIKNSKSYELRVCFFAGGIVNLYVDYLRGKLSCTLDDIPIEVGRMLKAYSLIPHT